MPQLSQITEIYASQLFWLAIVFALIYFGIGKAMVPKIERTIDDRNARISGDLAAAAAARDTARADEERYQAGLDAARSQAAKAVADAKATAGSNAEAALKAGDAAAAERLSQATDTITTSKRRAVAEIESATVDAVESILTKVSGVHVDRVRIESQVKAELAHG